VPSWALRREPLLTRTCERLEALRQAKALPSDLVDLCARALELACRLRLQAQIHYREESETIYLEPDREVEHPLLLAYADRQALEEIDLLLFAPLRQMDLSQGLDLQLLVEAKIPYLEKLVQEERMAAAEALLVHLPNPPSEIAASLALWGGRFETACELFEQGRDSDTAFIEGFNPYRIAMQAHSQHTESNELNELAGRLALLKMRGYRQPTLEPPEAIFAGNTQGRRRALWRYLIHLTLPEEMAKRAGEYAHRCISCQQPLPNDPQDLFSALLPIEKVNSVDLLYGDLILRLRNILKSTRDTSICSYLFHLFPPTLKGRFLDELTRANFDPALCQTLAHFPKPDGSRPLFLPTSPPWSLHAYQGSSSSTLEGVNTACFSLSSEAASFVKALIKGKKVAHGRHFVGQLHGTYLKLNPEFPGRAFAYLSLKRLVTGYTYPTRELLKLTMGSKRHALSGSQEVPGPLLQERLDRQPQLKNLDFRHYCYDVLMTLLTLPEDQKPDNIVIHQPSPTAPERLVDVDPERVFFDAMSKSRRGHEEIQCKSILLCLDQMLQPIDPTVRAEFLALHPAAFFDRWLDEIDHYNQQCKQLFGGAFINQALKGSPTCEIPFFLEPTTGHEQTGIIRHRGLLLRLYDRFRALQEALRGETTTLIDLLLIVEPKLGALYLAELKTNKPAITRFCDVTKNQYKRSKGSTLAITSSILRGAYSNVEKFHKHGWTVDNARKDLKRILQAHATQEAIRDDLITGQGLTLKALDLPEVSESVLKTLDFSQLPKDSQKLVLARITGLNFRRLHLAGCQVLTDRKLKAILTTCSNLTFLDLGNSKGVSKLTYLQKYCPSLQKLNLRGISTLQNLSSDRGRAKAPLVLPALEQLDISHCQIKRLHLQAKNLKVFRCRGSAFPVDFTLDSNRLDSLSVDDRKHLRRLIQLYKPQTICFGKTEIRQTKGFNPAKLFRLISITKHGNLIAYHTGPASQGELLGESSGLGEACSLGLPFTTFSVRDRSTKATTFVRELDPRQDTFLFFWRCVKRGLDPKQIDPSLLGTITDSDLETMIHDWNKLATSSDTNDLACIDGMAEAITTHCPNYALRVVDSLAKLGRRINLTNLDLSGCKKLRDAALIAVAEHCPGLTNLNLYRCSGLSDAALIAVAEHCSGLTHLDLSVCRQLSDAALIAVAEHCPGLTNLNLYGCTWLSDAALIAIAEHCPGLTYLNLYNCRQLSDAALVAVAEHCPGLTYLNLSWCSGLSDAALIAVAEHCSGLTNLDLSGCKKLSDAALIAIAEHCPGLTNLNLTRCKQLSNAALIVVAKHCPGLTYLDLTWGRQLSDAALITVAEHCPGLTNLDLSYCDQLSDSTLIAVAKHCPSLTNLNLTGCTKLSDAGKARVREILPNAYLG